MKQKIIFWLAVAWFIGSPLALISWFIYNDVSVWKECRATNSFFYCVRLMNK